jgi:hypothetical protein
MVLEFFYLGIISIYYSSCCRTAVGVGQRALSLSAHTAGGPPPLLALGRVTSPRHILGVRLVLLWGRCYGKRVVLTIRERASTPPLTQEVLVAGALSAAAFASGVGGMDHGAWRRRRTSTCVGASEYLTARLRRHGEASATPCGSGYGDTSSFGFF